jgi:hypothetical protein
MKAIADLTREELAGLVAQHLADVGIDVVLTGGSCVSIYSNERYVSKDLDFIDISLRSNREIGRALQAIGFRNQTNNSRYFVHPDTDLSIEFPSAPLTLGDELVPEEAIANRETSQGTLRLLSPTDCVKDRLANFYYFKDRQCYEQALMVAKAQPINLKALKKWHANENQADGFERFIEDL